MAKPVHASSDIWYRSVEDLLSALDTGKATAASTALAINLQTSAVPLNLGLKASLQFEGLHVYRLLHRLENGLPQFQLRLGIIESDLQADAILAIVREHYPGATKRPVGDADRTAIARMVNSAQSRNTTGARDSIRAPRLRAPLEAAAVTSKPRKASATEDLQWNIDEVLRHLMHRPAQSDEQPHDEPSSTPPPAAASPSPKPSPGLRTTSVAPETSAQRSTADSGELQSIVDRIGALTCAAEAHREARSAASRDAAAPPVPSTPAPDAPPVELLCAPDPITDPDPDPVTDSVPAPRTVSGGSLQRAAELPAIDSTQTVRALTSFELDDDAETSRWFVLQLMHSPEPIDPEQVPDLDIFSEYRLYAVGEADQGACAYALRLGFFSSELAAGAVAAYLAPHFPTTDIKRVSVAEHDRFAQNVVVAKKDVGLAGSHAVIEFSSPRALPTALPDAPAVLPATASIGGRKPPPQAASSLWSRLMPRRMARE